MWQGWIDLAAGMWLIVCSFVPALQSPASMIVGGVAAIIFGFWGASRVHSWQGTVNGLIGVWLFLSAVAFFLVVPWNFFASGIVIGVLAIWNIAQNPMQTIAHTR